MSVHNDVEFKLSPAGIGRFYAGLAWDGIYDGKELSKGQISRQQLSDFLNPQTFFLILLGYIGVLIAYVSYAFLFDVSLSVLGAFIAFIIATIVIGYLVFLYVKNTPSFLLTPKKEEDDMGRDKKFGHFDIDLHCMVFDKNGTFLLEISPRTEHMLSLEGGIYHSGEDTDGQGVYDDEAIYVESRKLPPEYHSFVFCASNDCAHEFNKVPNLKIRLADSYRDNTVIDSAISSAEADGYIFCLVYREEGKWFYRRIDKYLRFAFNWEQEVRKMVFV